ncbi:MAG: Ig-like domain repeat protein, partial [Treponema sp.]|nr:Ig-like domain repeat protein [Treponema sp.]
MTNVPPTIDMSVATWKDENYNLIYGDSKDGTKYYYCEVIVHDEARKIPFDENDKGNTLTYYYFNDDIYSDLLSVYKATELYKILNGSYTRENIKPFKNLSDEQIATKVLEVKNILNEATKQTKKGTFSLNPENNPYFELDGYKEVDTDSIEEKATVLKSKNPLTNGNPLNISILVGLDQAPIVEDTIGIKLNKILFKDGKYTIDEANPIWYIKPAADAKTKNELACRKLLTKVGANYKVSLKLTSSEVELEHEKTKETYVLPTLEVGNSYLVSVVGQDQNGIEFVQSYTHGIYFESNGNPPRLKITQPEGASVYLKKDSALELSGTVEADDFTTIKVYVEDKLIEGENSSWTSTVNNPSMNLDGTGTGVWSGIVIPASEFAQDESKEYFITVKAFAGTKESEKGLTVNYDVEGPIIEVNKIEPQVTFADANGNIRSDNVNGVFAVQVRIEDDFHRVDTTNKKPTINIYEGNKVLAEKLIYTATSETASTTWNINTREGKFADLDKTEITIEIVAYDESGNESKLTKVVYLNQDSDKPVIELKDLVTGEVDGKDYSGSEYPNGGTKNIITAESVVTATITDDDKLSQVVVKIKPNGTEVEQEIITKTCSQEEITSNPWVLSFTSPKSVGNYVAEIEVTDETGITSDVAKFWFKIDAGYPTIAINNGSYFGTTGKPINVQGSVSGFGGLVIYNKYDIDTSTGTKISGSQPDVLDTTFSFEDAFVVTETTEGKASCKYAVTDSNGRTTTRDFDYIVDLSNPTVTTTLQIPLQGISSTDYKFTGITSDVENEFTSGVEAIFYQIIGANAAAPTVESASWTEVSASSTWSFYQKFKEATASQETEGLPEGSYKLYVYAKDKAGNISEMNTTSFDVDLNKPTVQLYYNDGIASDNAVQKTNKDYKFSFVVNDTYKLADTPYAIVVTKDGVTLANGTDYSVAQNAGKYNVTIKNYVDGNYVFKVTAIDWKAKETTSSLNITLDKTAPTIEVISPVADEWQTAAKLSIKGTSEDASGVASITAKDSQGNPV